MECRKGGPERKGLPVAASPGQCRGTLARTLRGHLACGDAWSRPCVRGWLGLQFHALVKTVLLKLRAVALTRGLSLYRVLVTSWGL